MADKTSPLPMLLTLSRMIAGPVVAGLVLLASTQIFVDRGLAAIIYFCAAGLFAAAALTDWLDGHLARKLGAVSALGAALDHAADKVLVACVLVALAYAALPLLLIAAAVLILGRDMAVAGLREGLSNSGRALPVSFAGKLKASVEMVAVTALLVVQGAALVSNMPVHVFFALSWFASAALWTAALLALWSGFDYAASALSPAPAPEENAEAAPRQTN
jgi:CDP-diacylglycerol---glycerol-3-phosphate 3-phosphatidyltransferase